MSRKLGGFLVLCLFAVAPAFAGAVVLDLTCPAETKCVIDGSVVLRSSADAAVTRRVVVEKNAVRIAEAAGSEWEATLDAKGFWSAPFRIVIPDGDVERRQTADVWRTGHVRFQLQGGNPAPAETRIGIAAAPDRRQTREVPRGTIFPCAKQETAWSCEVPAATLDVAVLASGFAPHYKWDVKVSTGAPVDLGAIVLKKGASIVAWLDAETSRNVKVPVRAFLRRHATADPSVHSSRLAAPVAEATFTKKGAVQLAPLAAGRYILEAVAEGFAPARIPVEVPEGREVALRRSIELSPAIAMRLRFDPPVAPDGTPWTVDLWRRIEFGSGWERAGGGAASAEGIFESTEQAEGTIRLALRDGKKNVLANQELVLVAGGGEQVVTLDIAAITGRVTIGEDPLPNAALAFIGTGGRERIRATADVEGRFAVALPRRGKWEVDVDAAAESVSASATLDIPENGDTVDIELPATEVTGWVTGPDGNRFAGAEVDLTMRRTVRTRPSAGDGTFRFRGVPAGTVSVRATDRGTRAYSRTIEVTVPEEGVAANVALKIEGLRTVKGVVRSGGTAVVGAHVSGYAFIGGSAMRERATTDIQGSFSLDAPESAAEVILVVGAAGLPLHTFTARVPSAAAVLDVPSRGGSLRLQWPENARPLRVFFNDTMLPLGDLLDWARSQGESFRPEGAHVPNVAAGSYKLCSPERCVAGTLAAGATLDLDLNGTSNDITTQKGK